MTKSDKHKHIQLSLRVPLWLYEPWERTLYAFRKWKYWAFPDHCECCGKRMFVRGYEIEHYFENGQRLVIGNHCYFDDKLHVVCRDCIADQLETGEWKPRFSHMHEQREGKPSKDNYRFWSEKKCAITGKRVRSYKDLEIYPYIDMTFCTIAWNHDYISKEAVIECAKKGKIKTSICGIYKQKMAPMNHKRLFIDKNGDLL